MKSALQFSESALRVGVAVAVLALAAWMATPKTGSLAGAPLAAPKPGIVLEW